MPVIDVGEKMIVPSLFHDPLRGFCGASQSVNGGEPSRSTFFNLPSAKKAMKRLSGDQNGNTALSVPLMSCGDPSMARSHSPFLPSALVAGNVTYRPLGEIVSDPTFSWSSVSFNSSGIGTAIFSTRDGACNARK